MPDVVAERVRFRDDICPHDDDADRYMRETVCTYLLYGGGVALEQVNEVTTVSSSLTLTGISFTGSI